MKTIIKFVLLISFILQTGCKQITEPVSGNIQVSFDVQSAFQDDSVKVVLNCTILPEARITTDYTVSLAWSSGIQKLSGENHFLLFDIVGYGVQKDFNVTPIYDTSTVFILFNKSTNQISINQIRSRILYD